jgi:hypothetical protein
MVSLLSGGETILRGVEENNYCILLTNTSILTDEAVRSALLTASDIGKILRIPDHE